MSCLVEKGKVGRSDLISRGRCRLLQSLCCFLLWSTSKIKLFLKTVSKFYFSKRDVILISSRMVTTFSRERRGFGSGLFLGWNLEKISVEGEVGRSNFILSPDSQLPDRGKTRWWFILIEILNLQFWRTAHAVHGHQLLRGDGHSLLREARPSRSTPGRLRRCPWTWLALKQAVH